MLSPNRVSVNLREWHVGQKVRKGHWLWGSRKDDGTPSQQVSLGALDFPMSFLLNPIDKPRWDFEHGRDGGSGLQESDGPDNGASFPFVYALGAGLFLSWVRLLHCWREQTTYVWGWKVMMARELKGRIVLCTDFYSALYFILIPPSDPRCRVLHSLVLETCLEMEWRKDSRTDICTEKLELGRLGLLCWSNTN